MSEEFIIESDAPSSFPTYGITGSNNIQSDKQGHRVQNSLF